MWLEYAKNRDHEYVSITEVPRGRSELYCPYCQGELIAKKGKVKAHHFAHLGETCNYVQNTESVQLPMYKQFNLNVPRKFIQPLLEHWDKSTLKNPKNPPNSYQLTNYNLTVYNSYAGNGRGAYEYTKLGLIVVGGLSLDLFNKIQEPILIDKLTYYEQDILQAKETNSIDLKDKITDYEIYRNQYRYILKASLYFLEITTNKDVFYKIGITTRQLAQRISEIQQELSQFFSSVSIKGLGFWTHRGNVEHYFKHRYRKYKYPLANYTEYFKFDDVKPILRDLRRMKPKVLSKPEQEILDNKPLDKVLLSLYIKHGMEKTKSFGFDVGRPKETESIEQFLAKPKNQAIATVLKKGYSIRRTAKELGVAINTVRKVKTATTTSIDRS